MKEKEVILQILGMTCPSCAQGIEAGLARLEGVIKARVNFPAKEAIVKFDEEKVTLDKIKAAIKRGGYEAVEQVEDTSERRRKEVRNKMALFFFGLALTIPIFYISFFMMFPEKNYVLLALATPVQFVVGWHFYRGAFSSIRNRFADMNVLVALSSSVAYCLLSLHCLLRSRRCGILRRLSRGDYHHNIGRASGRHGRRADGRCHQKAHSSSTQDRHRDT